MRFYERDFNAMRKPLYPHFKVKLIHDDMGETERYQLHGLRDQVDNFIYLLD